MNNYQTYLLNNFVLSLLPISWQFQANTTTLCPQEEYLEALNEQEIVQKQLNGIVKQRDGVAREVDDMSSRGKTLQTLYQEQDELLGKVTHIV